MLRKKYLVLLTGNTVDGSHISFFRSVARGNPRLQRKNDLCFSCIDPAFSQRKRTLSLPNLEVSHQIVCWVTKKNTLRFPAMPSSPLSLESFGLQVLEPQGKESNGSISQPSESPGAAGGAPLSTPRVPGPNKDE